MYVPDISDYTGFAEDQSNNRIHIDSGYDLSNRHRFGQCAWRLLW